MANYEQNKDTSEDLLRQILDQSTSLNSIEISMINQILAVFKISENPMTDRTIKINKIKQKLIYIITDEKQQCVNYFTLPKFKTLSEGSKILLKEVTKQTWNQFQKRSIQEEKIKKCERYFCRTDNIQQAQQFHLSLFLTLKNYYFYEPAYFQTRPITNYPPMIMSNEHPYVYSGNQNFENFFPNSNSNNNNNNTNIKIEEPKADQLQQSNVISTNVIGEKQKKNKEKDMKDKSFQYKKQNKKETINNTRKQISPMPFLFKTFVYCYCKGKKSDSERSFQCQQCQKKYHLSCLNIPLNAVQRPNVKKQCPQCFLKNTNALYTVIETLETFWSDDKDLHKQKITIKSKKCKQILEKKYLIQFKFTKIEGRSMYSWDQHEQNIQQQNGAAKAMKSILNQVVIKDQVLCKGNGEDVKISLDCMKGSENRDDKKPILLFVALNVIKQKTFDEIVNFQYEYFEDNYLDRFFHDKTQIKIQILDTQFKIFSTPVRGSDCDHPDLFDLQEFVSHCIDLHSDLCFCCSRRCRTFKIDRKVQEEITKIKNTISDENKYPHAIYYRKDGTFRWHVDAMEQEGLNNKPQSYESIPQPFLSSDNDQMKSQDNEMDQKIQEQQ